MRKMLPKDYVKQRFPLATFVYKDKFDFINRCFRKVYSIYMDDDIGWPTDATKKKLGEGSSLSEAWANAQFNIEVR